MNILVLGNGFDLAHELPTKYNDFLDFLNLIKDLSQYQGNLLTFENDTLHHSSIYDNVISYVNSIISKIKLEAQESNLDIYATGCSTLVAQSKDSILQELASLLSYNVWFEYFKKAETYLIDGWIDFESEIAKVIHTLDNYRRIVLLDNKKIEDMTEKEQPIVKEIIQLIRYKNIHLFSFGITEKDFDALAERLENDLKGIIRCLEIYLEDCVGQMAITQLSPDIKNIKFDKVLSFNYTNTYQKMYAHRAYDDTSYDFIHGKSNLSNTIETNNIVLGIDEYLDDESKNKETLFIPFKKFYQRVHKETGCKYKDWLDTIQSDVTQRHELFIFGHSLDITDKDVLRDLIKNENVKTTIFYYNKKVYGTQIKNLVKVLGQDTLIASVHGEHKSIFFKQQQDFSTILEVEVDIRKLYSPHQLSTPEIKQLIHKINEKVITLDSTYFSTQENVVSVFDAFQLITTKLFDVDTFLKIAEKIDDRSKFIRLFSEDWENFDFMGNDITNSKTIELVTKINASNEKKWSKGTLNEFEQAIVQKNVTDLLPLIRTMTKLTNDHVADILNLAFKILDTSDAESEVVWNSIYALTGKIDEKFIRNFITDKLNFAQLHNDYILEMRLSHLLSALDEDQYTFKYADLS